MNKDQYKAALKEFHELWDKVELESEEGARFKELARKIREYEKVLRLF